MNNNEVMTMMMNDDLLLGKVKEYQKCKSVCKSANTDIQMKIWSYDDTYKVKYDEFVEEMDAIFADTMEAIQCELDEELEWVQYKGYNESTNCHTLKSSIGTIERYDCNDRTIEKYIGELILDTCSYYEIHRVFQALDEGNAKLFSVKGIINLIDIFRKCNRDDKGELFIMTLTSMLGTELYLLNEILHESGIQYFHWGDYWWVVKDEKYRGGWMNSYNPYDDSNLN